MSPLQQAFVLTSAAFMVGIAMIVGAVSLRPQQHSQIVTAPITMTGDDMGVTGKDGEPNGSALVAPRS